MIFLEFDSGTSIASIIFQVSAPIVTIALFLILNFRLYTKRRDEERSFSSKAKLYETVVLKRMESLSTFANACHAACTATLLSGGLFQRTISREQIERVIERFDAIYEKHRVEDVEMLYFYNSKLPKRIEFVMGSYYDKMTYRVAQLCNQDYSKSSEWIPELHKYGARYSRGLARRIAAANPVMRINRKKRRKRYSVLYRIFAICLTFFVRN